MGTVLSRKCLVIVLGETCHFQYLVEGLIGVQVRTSSFLELRISDLARSTMSRKGWRSTVTVGGKTYTGEGRALREVSMFAAARVALEKLGQPFQTRELSNVDAQASLERYCKANKLGKPSYSTPEECMYTPKFTGGGRRRKPVQSSLMCAVVRIGTEWFRGEGTYGVENAETAAARCALEQKGQVSGMMSNAEVLEALACFSESRGFGEPKYKLYFGGTIPDEVLGASPSLNTDSEGRNSIAALDDVSKTFQSQEPQLVLVVSYNDGRQKGSQWEVVCSVTLGKASKQFTGTASSKQDAKELAAHKAYEWLSEQLRGIVSEHTSLSFADPSSIGNAAKINSRSMEALRQVCHNLLEPLQGDVMAAILMTHPGQEARIVCIGSGTGFINHEHLVNDGRAVFDCHAEVLARRGLQAFLFKQVESASKEAPSIVHKKGGKFHLREGVGFHLFINKVPCGDAGIITSAEHAGHLRYRKEDGEGDLLKPDGNLLQYKICCSAKIAQWNVVGLQGALLARVLAGPVYLSTIIVQGAEDGHRKDRVCKATLERAFFGRLHNVQGLPPGYRVNQPNIVVLPSDGGAKGGSGHSKHLGVCWAAGCEKEEVIEATTGLRKKGDLDVSKRGFANQWASLYPHDEGKPFQAVKRNAGDYQRAKQEVEACLPGWIHKSPEYDSFNI